MTQTEINTILPNSNQENSVFLMTVAASPPKVDAPQFVCRCYSDGDVIIEKSRNSDPQLLMTSPTPITCCTFFEEGDELFLVLATEKKIYITCRAKDSKKKFFMSGARMKQIEVSVESDIVCIDGICISTYILICAGHYNGQVSCFAGSSKDNVREIFQPVNSKELINLNGRNRACCMKIKVNYAPTGEVYDTDGDVDFNAFTCNQLLKGGQVMISLLTACGALNLYYASLVYKDEINLQVEFHKTFKTVNYPMDLVVDCDNFLLSICGQSTVCIIVGMDHQFHKYHMQRYTISDSLLCALCAKQEKNSIILFCGDQYGKIYQQELSFSYLKAGYKSDESLAVVKTKKLYSFPVGSFCTVDGKVVMYDHFNHILTI